MGDRRQGGAVCVAGEDGEREDAAARLDGSKGSETASPWEWLGGGVWCGVLGVRCRRRGRG